MFTFLKISHQLMMKRQDKIHVNLKYNITVIRQFELRTLN